jgi:hypothetical protein
MPGCEIRAMANFLRRFRTPQRYLKDANPNIPARRANVMRQLNAESHFHNDLGLDSLDTVEVVMAIEEVSCRI